MPTPTPLTTDPAFSGIATDYENGTIGLRAYLRLRTAHTRESSGGNSEYRVFSSTFNADMVAAPLLTPVDGPSDGHDSTSSPRTVPGTPQPHLVPSIPFFDSFAMAPMVTPQRRYVTPEPLSPSSPVPIPNAVGIQDEAQVSDVGSTPQKIEDQDTALSFEPLAFANTPANTAASPSPLLTTSSVIDGGLSTTTVPISSLGGSISRKTSYCSFGLDQYESDQVWADITRWERREGGDNDHGSDLVRGS